MDISECFCVAIYIMVLIIFLTKVNFTINSTHYVTSLGSCSSQHILSNKHHQHLFLQLLFIILTIVYSMVLEDQFRSNELSKSLVIRIV
jgi:hypothetical protein